MKELSTWDKYDWSLDGSENVLIMSEIADEMVRWVADRQESEAQRLMDLVENLEPGTPKLELPTSNFEINA